MNEQQVERDEATRISGFGKCGECGQDKYLIRGECKDCRDAKEAEKSDKIAKGLNFS